MNATLPRKLSYRTLEERRICPGCQRRIEADYFLCPDCHYQLRLRCPSCDRLLNPSWDICPYCGVYRDVGALAASDQARPERAPTRWLSRWRR